MKIHRRILSIAALLLLSTSALACSWPSYTPQESYKASSVVVLAYPIAIANEPSNALASTFKGEFKQRVEWQVLGSWKGQYRPGDVLLTWVSYQTSICGDGAQRERAVKLLYLTGREPYKEMIDLRPDNSIKDMKYLDRLQHDG